jgi:hypothetical protein
MVTDGANCVSWSYAAIPSVPIRLILAAFVYLVMLITSSQNALEAKISSKICKDYVIVAIPERHYWKRRFVLSCQPAAPFQPFFTSQDDKSSLSVSQVLDQNPWLSEPGLQQWQTTYGGRGGSNLWSSAQRDHAWDAYTHSRNEKITEKCLDETQRQQQ